MTHRLTRRTQIKNKIQKQQTLPVSLVAINFQFDSNLGFLTRAAACFGAKEVIIIGTLRNNKKLRQISVGTSLYTTYKVFKQPNEFLKYARDANIVSLDIKPVAAKLFQHKFNPKKHTYIVTGNETTGVPVEILHHSTILQIPMPGFGTCLNTSQAANIALYEYVRQWNQDNV